jgi:hypothetical protein
VTHVILVLMVLPNFWNPLLPLIPFWRAGLALVQECYGRNYIWEDRINHG